VLVLGGLTLWLQDSTFIKMKPTVYYLTVSSILLVGLWFKRLVLKDVLDVAVHLKDEGWRKLTTRVAGLFIFLAIANELVWRNLPEEVWVWTKVAGFIPLTAVFLGVQFYLLVRDYEIPSEERPEPVQGADAPPAGE
jgi:intracellular septation protein